MGGDFLFFLISIFLFEGSLWGYTYQNIWKKGIWNNYILKHRLFEGYYSGYSKNKILIYRYKYVKNNNGNSIDEISKLI